MDAELRRQADATMAKMQAMAERARTIEAYDQMIAEGNTEGNAVVQAAIDGLIDQTRSIERAVAALELEAHRTWKGPTASTAPMPFSSRRYHGTH